MLIPTSYDSIREKNVFCPLVRFLLPYRIEIETEAGERMNASNAGWLEIAIHSDAT